MVCYMKCINGKNKKRLLNNILSLNNILNDFAPDASDVYLGKQMGKYEDANYISKKKVLKNNNKQFKIDSKRI